MRTVAVQAGGGWLVVADPPGREVWSVQPTVGGWTVRGSVSGPVSGPGGGVGLFDDEAAAIACAVERLTG